MRAEKGLCYGRASLGRAQRARERSDYAPTISLKESEAKQIFLDAEVFIAKMKEIVAGVSGANQP